MIFTIVGTGYVGLSLSVLLSQKHKVIALDIDNEKVKKINSKISPINDDDIIKFFSEKRLDLYATTNKSEAYNNSDFVVIATPTNYDEIKGSFNTTHVENSIGDSIHFNPAATIIIKSTVPLGFTDKMKKKFTFPNIIFSPEFLREGKALHDNLYPSRIVIGDKSEKAHIFSKALIECSSLEKNDLKVHYMSSKESEAVKLFSNTFLAMRIAFFNELDTFAEINNINSENIIKGVCSDSRIGNYYNNPSFGYGGYCLPKDTKQLLDNYKNIPNSLIKSVIESNQTRKEFIAGSIMNMSPKTVGIHKLAMKKDSENFRESAVLDLINILKKNNINIILYEPSLNGSFNGIDVIDDFENFKLLSDIIVSNRMSEELESVKDKVYCRDIFNEN
tara:strand:- start:970 stop:2139 length:1170 start_codon:yes stop_codon:yes gene_type:complete